MEKENNINLSSSEYKKMMGMVVDLNKDLTVLTLENANLKYQLLLREKMDQILNYNRSTKE